MTNKKSIILFEKIKDYLTYYLPVVRSKSENTIIAYRTTLNMFLSFVKEHEGVELSDITKTHFTQEMILAFLDWVKTERGNSPSTRNQRLVHLRQFCRYLMSTDIISFNALAKINEIKEEPEPPSDSVKFLSIAQTKLVLNQPDTSTKLGLRDHFFLTLLYDSGCRLQETLDLKLQDMILVRGEPEIHVIGKGRKYRVTPISHDVYDIFIDYCEAFHPNKNPCNPIFYTLRKDIQANMSVDNVQRFMIKYEKILKKSTPDLPHLHPHLFRHTRAMHLYMAGLPLYLVAEWLGHSRIETTQIYANATTQMKRQAVEKIYLAENAVFSSDEKFKYADNDEVIKKLYGLS